ncbi:hypothetical protein QUF54_00215 [Candidatus Marithioploca araucensis]|uniref:Uncharacterized protein n=1 Tax=Candidatus Marithioploca araucensis TaxID=70273 RepID=A0ABT7VQ26_9GAMM|nr:hypothetical protein [Candidatus Marithioploca araucensis]
MNKRQSPLKNAMLTGLLTVSLAGFTVPVFAKPGGSPAEECGKYGASYFYKCDFKGGTCVKDPDSKGDVTIVGDETSGTWSSDTAIDIMIVKGGTLRDPTMYDPAENNGPYNNGGIGGKDISHLTFCVYEPQQRGACVVTFEDETQSCYQWHHQGDEACKATVGTTFTPPGMEVIGAEWHLNDNCKNLGVKLLATGVSLTAKVAGNKVKLKLTTSAEPGTAALLILRGNKLSNGGTEIDVACEFPSGGSPYTCTDDSAADTYRAAEIEYNGRLIIYDEVTPK